VSGTDRVFLKNESVFSFFPGLCLCHFSMIAVFSFATERTACAGIENGLHVFATFQVVTCSVVLALKR
jgi:hypothetical protein